MCGIAGFTHTSGPPQDSGILTRAIESIRHRGPDQQGFHRTPEVSLGAVRLKILDLTGGDQPIECNGTVIAFNGEIYNFRELRSELEGLGHHFDSHCDTEVVLHAFLQWDVRAFERLRGMFAVALWQQSSRRLVLARDRMGIKPLYVFHRGADLHFGSELKAIFEHPQVPRHIDWQALDLYLAQNYIPSDRTLVDGIYKLKPGYWLDWRDGAVTSESYWTLRFNPQPISFEDAKQRLDQLLADSVREHMVSDVPLGVWLSGGLDSSTIVHYASQAFPGKLKTYSISFYGHKFDESPYFRSVAEHYQTEHHEFDLSPEHDLATTIERMVYHLDEPSADAGALPIWYLSQMCRKDVTVALSGEGADEMFGGYITYLADRYAAHVRKLPRILLPLALDATKLLPVSDDKVGFEYKLKRFLRGCALEPTKAHLFWSGACTPMERYSMMRKRVAGEPGPFDLPAADDVNRFLYLDQLGYLPNDILTKCDRISMAHSLEVRPPFLDHRLVEFAASLPLEHKIRGRNLKHVLRQLMKPRLPKAVTSRSKQGLDIPTQHWFRTALRPMLTEVINEDSVNATGLFHWQPINKMMRDHFERRANNGYQLWGLLTLFLWLRRWRITA